MIEAAGLFSKVMRFDGEILEIMSHGQSTDRIAVKEMKDIKRTDEPNGALTLFVTYSGGWATFGFSVEQRPKGEELVRAVEAARM